MRPHLPLRSIRDRYRTKRLAVTALVILLLVPAGVLAVRSLFVSLAAADEVTRQQKVTEERRAKEQATAGPFTDTPAAHFPEGQAGISTPEATQVGDWSADQVGQVLGHIKQVLALARLDDRVLSGDAAPYTDQLAMSARGPVSERLNSQEGLGYVTRVSSGYHLAAPTRVSGSMSVDVGGSGQLSIVADFVWVYALTGEAAAEATQGPGGQVVVLHTIERFEWYPDKGYLPEDRGLRPANGQQYLFNVDCELAKSGWIALPRTPAPKHESSNTDEVFDPKTPVDKLPNNC